VSEKYAEEEGDDSGHDDEMMDRMSISLVLTMGKNDELEAIITRAEEELKAEEYTQMETEENEAKINDEENVGLTIVDEEIPLMTMEGEEEIKGVLEPTPGDLDVHLGATEEAIGLDPDEATLNTETSKSSSFSRKIKKIGGSISKVLKTSKLKSKTPSTPPSSITMQPSKKQRTSLFSKVQKNRVSVKDQTSLRSNKASGKRVKISPVSIEGGKPSTRQNPERFFDSSSKQVVKMPRSPWRPVPQGEEADKAHVCCDKLYQAHLHPTVGSCQICLFRLSSREKVDFEKNGRHLRVNRCRGGCIGCNVFPSKEDEQPVRLCRRCFFDTHKLKKTEKAFGACVLPGIASRITIHAV
jgi:hypothetical protein